MQDDDASGREVRHLRGHYPRRRFPVLIGSRVMCDAFRCFGPTLADAGDTTAAALMQIRGWRCVPAEGKSGSELGEELHLLEAAGRDDREFRRRPNVVLAERVAGRVVYRGRQPCVAVDGRLVPMAARSGLAAGAAVTATIVEQVGERQRAYDISKREEITYQPLQSAL